VRRDGTFVVPRGDTEIRAGDEVVFVGPHDDIKTAHETVKTTAEA
jgi:Trk K+ transport system NAD-binding subunit